jgi:outer membrane protein W
MRVVPLLVLTLTTFSAFAQSNDVGVWAGRSTVGRTPTGGSEIRFDGGDAFGVSFTHFFSNHYAGEVAAFNLRHEGTIRVAGVDALDIGRLTMTPIVLTLQWHAEHTHRFDPYAGGGLAWVRSSSIHSADLDSAGIGRVSVKSRTGWTAVVGASYAFMKPVAIAGEARFIGYHPSSGPSDARVTLNLSPVIYSLGVRWRF